MLCEREGEAGAGPGGREQWRDRESIEGGGGIDEREERDMEGDWATERAERGAGKGREREIREKACQRK